MGEKKIKNNYHLSFFDELKMTVDIYNEQPVTKITNTLFIYNINKQDHKTIHDFFKSFNGFYESKLFNTNNKFLLFIVFINKITASEALKESYLFIKKLGYTIIYSRESTKYLEKINNKRRLSDENHDKTSKQKQNEKPNEKPNEKSNEKPIEKPEIEKEKTSSFINENELYESIYKLDYKNPSKSSINSLVKWNNSLSIYKEDKADENWIFCYINNTRGLRTAIVIYDKYPKGKYHLLLLPLINFASEPKFFTRDHLFYIKAFNNCARFIANVLSNKYNKKFIVGYHKYPSMKDLHIHIVSDEIIKKKKNKKFLDSEEFLSVDFIEFHLEKYPDFSNIY